MRTVRSLTFMPLLKGGKGLGLLDISLPIRLSENFVTNVENWGHPIDTSSCSPPEQSGKLYLIKKINCLSENTPKLVLP